jgi:hypothetical protein
LRLRQEDPEFKFSLGYVARPYLQKGEKKKKISIFYLFFHPQGKIHLDISTPWHTPGISKLFIKGKRANIIGLQTSYSPLPLP